MSYAKCQESYIILPSAKVIEICEYTISEIEKLRKDEDEKFIAKTIEDHRKSWLRKLFRRPVMTREEAIARLSKPAEFTFVNPYPSFRGWGTMITAEKLLHAAKHSDTVTVSVADFDHLWTPD